RLCLVYNLTLAMSQGKQGMTAPTTAGVVEAVKGWLDEWREADDAQKLAVTLAAYQGWLTGKIGDKKATVRSHGFRFRGQYEQELEADLDIGGVEITAGIPGENAQHKTV